MPEGDVVCHTARRLHEALAGRTLTRSDFRVPGLATADLTGDVVTETVSARQAPAHQDRERPHRPHPPADGRQLAGQARGRATPATATGSGCCSPTSDWQAIGYQLGVVELIRTSEESRVTGHLGPDLLGPDWDCAEAVRRLSAEPDRPIGEALLDQRNLAGIGNVYKAEVLFLRGLNPWQPVERRGRPRRGGRPGQAAARGEQGAARPHHHRQHAPRRGELGLRSPGPAVPPVRYADPFGRPAGPDHLLVPVLPARLSRSARAAATPAGLPADIRPGS